MGNAAGSLGGWIGHTLGPLTGLALLIAGAGVLVLGASEARRGGSPAPSFEERYQSLAQDEVFAELAQGLQGVVTQRLELVAVDEGRTVATATLLVPRDEPPILVGWRSELAEPVFYPDLEPEEELALVRALRRHLPAEARLFALPHRARRLARLLGRAVEPAAADDTGGLYVPEPWIQSAERLRARERARLAVTEHERDRETFHRLVHALLAPVLEGVAELQLLAEGRRAYLVMHLADAFMLALLRPELVVCGYGDVPAGGQLHDHIRFVRNWVRERGFTAYAVQPKGADLLRVWFLGRAEDTRRLFAHLLPFDTADFEALPALRLVYQHGAYWVWMIETIVTAESEKG